MSQFSNSDSDVVQDVTEVDDQPSEEQIKQHNDFQTRWNDAVKYLKAKKASHWSVKFKIQDLMRKHEHETLKVGGQPLIIDAYFECVCKKHISLLNIPDKQNHFTKCLSDPVLARKRTVRHSYKFKNSKSTITCNAFIFVHIAMLRLWLRT